MVMYFQKRDKSAMVGSAPSWSGDRGESTSTQVRPCLGSCQRKLGIFRYLFCAVDIDSWNYFLEHTPNVLHSFCMYLPQVHRALVYGALDPQTWQVLAPCFLDHINQVQSCSLGQTLVSYWCSLGLKVYSREDNQKSLVVIWKKFLLG